MSKMTEMKKIVMLWLLAFSVVAGRAEDVIQVVPLRGKARDDNGRYGLFQCENRTTATFIGPSS